MPDSELDKLKAKFEQPDDEDIILTDVECRKLIELLDNFCEQNGILITDADISDDIHLN